MLDLNKLEDDLDKTLGCETKESLNKWLSEKRNKQGKFVIINLDTMDYFKDNLKNINYFDSIEDARRTVGYLRTRG